MNMEDQNFEYKELTDKELAEISGGQTHKSYSLDCCRMCNTTLEEKYKHTFTSYMDFLNKLSELYDKGYYCLYAYN